MVESAGNDYKLIRFPIGKFDTQTAVCQDLGLNENSIASETKSMAKEVFTREEEVLSYGYTGSMYSAGTNMDFPFKVAFASRRVMTIAPSMFR